MVSLADGLDQFYDDCGRIIAGDESMEDVTVLRGLEESIYVRGLEDKSKALDIIDELVNLSGKVLTDVWLSFVLCDGKYPFWRVYELLKYEQALFIVKSGKVLKVTTRDVRHIRGITQMLEEGVVSVSKRQFMEIVKEARRVDGPEPLKLLIDAKFREGKFARGHGAQSFVNNLKNLVDTLYNNHNRRMDAVVEALDLISSYTKPQRGVEEEKEWVE
jgi:predicted RNA-binding protein